MEINKTPNIKPYQYNAFAESIISNHRDYSSWFHNNYIQLVGLESPEGSPDVSLDYFSGNVFGYIPLMKYKDFTKIVDSIRSKELLSIIRGGLSTGCAWYIFLDHYFIKDKKDFQCHHFIHDVLLYKDNGEEFEYMEFDGGIYTSHIIEYKIFIDAFCNHDNNCIHKLGINNSSSYKFEYCKFIEMIEDYTFSRNSLKNSHIYFDESIFHNDDFFGQRKECIKFYGIEVYELACKKVYNSIRKSQWLDFRIFYLLYEHKVNMIGKINYCVQSGFLKSNDAKVLVDQYIEIRDRLYACLLLVFKYNFTFKKSCIENIDKELDKIYIEEKQLLMELLFNLKCS
jgi:hypothetical protein